MLPADPSGVPGLGLDTVFLDLHTPDLALLFLPVPGTLEAVVARQELPLLLDVAELPGVEDNLVVLRLAVVQDGGVIETVGGKTLFDRKWWTNLSINLPWDQQWEWCAPV